MDPQTSLPAGGRQEQHSLIDGQELKNLVEASLTWLKTNQQIVNALNVFPVPDGDTGTNMLLTMQAAYSEIANSGEHNLGKMAHAVAQGALMGARGNSGVILSQLWRGFARSLDNFETMDARQLVTAMNEARNTAYKGVVRPVEGTILTVAKDTAAGAEEALKSTKDLIELLEAMVAAADMSVKNTPELLPILKQAGVVNSGGKGLFFLLEGMLRHIKGLPLETPVTMVQPLSTMSIEETMGSIEEGQDFELVLDFKPYIPLDLDIFFDDLSEMGTSIQLGEGDGMYRIHIHVPAEKSERSHRIHSKRRHHHERHHRKPDRADQHAGKRADGPQPDGPGQTGRDRRCDHLARLRYLAHIRQPGRGRHRRGRANHEPQH